MTNCSEEFDVPNLLLSYTYFLNKNQSCHLTLGYDIQDFRVKMVLYKNTKISILDINDWKNIIQNVGIIESFFYNNTQGLEFIEMPHHGGNVLFKFSTRDGKKCFISVYNNRKVVLSKDECSILLQLSFFINSIMSWYNDAEPQIQNYYDRYIGLCIKYNVLQLSSNHFSEICVSGRNYIFNTSRIFNEFPILCRKKIRRDLSQYYNNVKL